MRIYERLGRLTAISASSTRRRLWAILALALVLRLVHWAAVRDEPFFAQLAMDSQEYDRWAREIAAGDWLGSEVFFQAPLYPYAVAVLYSAAGARPDIVYLAQIALAVAGLWALFHAGRRLWGDSAGLAAAALGALYGPFLFYDVQLLKESPAVAVACFLLAALAIACQAARQTAWSPGGRPGRWWLVAGLLAGVLALLRENMLLVLPFLLPLAAGPSPDRLRGLLRPVLSRGGLFLLGTALALSPVALRNFVVGGDPLPTTFQGGVNFYIGNNPQADGTYRPIVPGKQIPALERREPVRLAEQELGRELSAAEVSSFWLGKALAWAKAEPAAFAGLQLRKLAMFWSWYEQPDAVDFYWVRDELSPLLRFLPGFGTIALLATAGLSILLRRRQLGPFAPALLFALGWTLSTVAFFVFSRYRLPVLPALLLLAAVPLAEAARAVEAFQQTRSPFARRQALVLALLVFLSLALPSLARFEPRRDLVHYNLGRLAEEAGNPNEAARHYAAALAENPKDFLSNLNLGKLAARAGAWPQARSHAARAAELEPRSDDAWSNLGSVHLAQGHHTEAAAAFERALALNPDNPAALHNRALLALAQGDRDLAGELNARVLELQPGNPAALRLRERLLAVPID
jgi:tetratricopeptide (TPR) repeat protein